jgi:hypothetical protein
MTLRTVLKAWSGFGEGPLLGCRWPASCITGQKGVPERVFCVFYFTIFGSAEV